MNKLNLMTAIVPLIIVAVGLIGWVTTLRGDLSAAQSQISNMKSEITPLQEEAKQSTIEISNLRTLIADLDRIEEVVEDIDVLLLRVDNLEESIDENDPAIEELKRNLAVANDQMKTIMADHMGFNDVLQELGKSGLLPSGERRTYGGYGGN